VETSLREPRPEKVAVVEEVRERLDSVSAAILTEYRGLHVSQMQELRRALTAAGGDYKVFKNTLVRRAAHEAGLDELEPFLEGPTAIAFVDGDVAAVAKVLRDFARANPSLVVKGGLIGRSLLDSRSAAALADLPSREVLLAQIAGMLAAPLQQLASLLNALPQKFAYALNALVESRGGAPAETEAAAEPTEAAETAEAATTEATPTTQAAPAADEEDAPAESVEGAAAETSADEVSVGDADASAADAPEAAPAVEAAEAATEQTEAATEQAAMAGEAGTTTEDDETPA
jgi:large subunit ribosomal protein L10